MKILILLVVIFSLNAFSMGKQPPKDLSSIYGTFGLAGCSNDTVDSTAIPHTVQFLGKSDGTAKIVLETRSSYLTTRVFTVLEGNKQKCLEDDNWDAKCRAKFNNGLVSMKVDWNCKLIYCLAETPKNYTFSMTDSNTLYYTHNEDVKCSYRRK